MINTELKSIENYCLVQQRIIQELKDIIQIKEAEIEKLKIEIIELKEGM